MSTAFPTAVPAALLPSASGAPATSAKAAIGRGKAHHWHRTDKARAILASLTADDVRTDRAPNLWGSLFDKTELRPLTEAAWDAYEQLKQLRKAAVDAELGHTFEQTQRPFNEARCCRWLDLYASLPEVAEVVADELASRRADREAA